MAQVRMVGVGKASQLIGVEKETIRAYIRDGRLPAMRLPNGYFRIREEDLDRMLEPVQAETVGV